MFHLPLSVEAFEELHLIRQLAQDTLADDNSSDVWSWGFGTGGTYTAKKYYLKVHEPITSNPLLFWIWKSCCTLKIKTFAWLVIMDRINTKDMIIRRHWNIDDGPHCVLCRAHTLETRDHLFFQCLFAHRVWSFLQIDWTQGDDMVSVATVARREFAQPFFVEVVFTAWWNIWQVRNDKTFRHINPTFRRWRQGFVHDLYLLGYRIKPRFKEALFRWIDFLPP